MGGFRIYGNLFAYAHASDIKLESVSDIRIYNNAFYGFNPTISNIQANVYVSEIACQAENIDIRNNIFYHNRPEDNPLGLSCIKVDEGFRNEVAIDNNLYYASDPSARLDCINYGTRYSFGDWEDYSSNTGYE